MKMNYKIISATVLMVLSSATFAGLCGKEMNKVIYFDKAPLHEALKGVADVYKFSIDYHYGSTDIVLNGKVKGNASDFVKYVSSVSRKAGLPLTAVVNWEDCKMSLTSGKNPGRLVKYSVNNLGKVSIVSGIQGVGPLNIAGSALPERQNPMVFSIKTAHPISLDNISFVKFLDKFGDETGVKFIFKGENFLIPPTTVEVHTIGELNRYLQMTKKSQIVIKKSVDLDQDGTIDLIELTVSEMAGNALLDKSGNLSEGGSIGEIDLAIKYLGEAKRHALNIQNQNFAKKAFLRDLDEMILNLKELKNEQ